MFRKKSEEVLTFFKTSNYQNGDFFGYRISPIKIHLFSNLFFTKPELILLHKNYEKYQSPKKL